VSRAAAPGARPDPGDVYDAAYYASGCGPRPYARDAVWLGFFGAVADRIAADIAPRTVLDAGCAMGLLVECLRARGIDAVGVDVSAYAVGQAAEEVRPHLRVGSILEPLGGPYDLVTCIEVLEHLDAADGEAAIANLCAAADDVLFSSSPSDFDEPTHRNVQPPEYWALAFARLGYYRDTAFDASFLTPWAVRFRRMAAPPSADLEPVLAGYERRLWALDQEAAIARDDAAARGAEAAAQAARAEAAEAASGRLAAEAAGLQAEVAAWRERWGILERSWVGALMRAAERLRGRR